MAYVKLGTKAVGDIVKIKVNGVATDFIVVHQGLPSDHDESCTGTWCLMKDIYTTYCVNKVYRNYYINSNLDKLLNDTFLPLIDEKIQPSIKKVTIPVNSQAADRKIFILSFYEVGLEGTSGKLDYFEAGYSTDKAKQKRIATYNGTACNWWARRPHTDNDTNVFGVTSEGKQSNWNAASYQGVRPAFVLPYDIWVSDDGTVGTNAAPDINASFTNLGEKNAPFNFGYTVTDADGDTLTVTEKLDSKTTNTRTGIASGTALTFGQGSTADGFRRILNGSHTIQITASDGKESTILNATFTKKVTSATVTLTTPLAVDGDITAAVLQVTGSIPDDATFKAEVTNNANDPSPVWQDATADVRKGVNIAFSNKTAAKGAAFNFRVSVGRGASGTGGYIEAVSGAFQ